MSDIHFATPRLRSALLLGRIALLFPLRRALPARRLAALGARAALSTDCWRKVEGLLIELGAEISERAGSRVGVRLFGDRRVFHRPHPSPTVDVGALASIREWLRRNGVEP